MISLRQLAGGVAVAAITMTIAGGAMAQQTTSSLSGSVVDGNDAAVAGASVTIIHTPTGAAKRLTTNASGRFFDAGMRVGGPYTIAITAPGMQPEIIEDVFMRLGQVESLKAVLTAEGASRDEIVVTGSRPQNAITITNGMGSIFSSKDLANQPSISRDVSGAVMRDPFVTVSSDLGERATASGTFAIAGSDPRLNGFVIDGMAQGNDFGLDSGLFPTLRQPISIDTIESVSVSASDYSVLATGFQGGLVNIVTKSGTNDLTGGAYYYYRDASMVGGRAFGRNVNTSAFSEKEYGLFAGGALVKDKLFFFGNYEKFTNTNPQIFDFGGVDPEIFNIIRGITQSVYGYDPGIKGNTAVTEGSEKYLGKIDWNISENHRATIKYQRSDDVILSNVGTFNFPTNYYELTSVQDVYTAELHSDWSENFSTIMRVSRKDLVRGQNALGDTSATGVGFGTFLIEIDANDPYFTANGLDGNALLGTNQIEFELGPDVFRHANAFSDTRDQVFFQGDYFTGNHAVTFGGVWDRYELTNLFGAFSAGEFNFSSLQALENQDAFVVYSNTQSNNALDGLVNWGYDKWAVFLQDEWAISPDLTVNYGFRYERFNQSDRPPAPEMVSNAAGTALSTFQSVYGFSGTDNLDGLGVFMPRVGFSFDKNDRLTISGGLGRFAGSNPEVWISNNFTPLQLFTVGFDTNVTGSAVPTSLLNSVGAGVQPGGAVQNVDIIDPNFKIPSTWRASLKADYNLDLSNFGMGDDYFVQTGILYSRADSPITWRNLAFDRADLQQFTGVAPDGRVIYPDLGDIPVPTDPRNTDGDPGTNGSEVGLPDAFLITNGKGGTSLSLVAGVSKNYDNGFGFNMNYTFTDAEDLLEFSSSRAISSWRGIVGTDRNTPTLGRSSNEIEHKFGMSFSYEKEVWEDLTSRLDVFGLIQSGRPFSYGYNVGSRNPLFGRANGGSPRDGADLLYIPTMSNGAFNDARVTFASAGDEADFLAFVNENGLAKYAGSILPRNSGTGPWNSRWDLRFQQELPGGFGQGYLAGNRFKFILDVQNFLNLLDSNWGQQSAGPRFGRVSAVGADLVHVASGEILSDNEPGEFCKVATDCVYRYRNVTSSVERQLNFQSLYRVRVGIRYEF
ncbi:MAG: TonB-dependent receptor [Robiginitomaculum sp.]|nr:TonB-dependent receptor [Robiginitomaculum sp.]